MPPKDGGGRAPPSGLGGTGSDLCCAAALGSAAISGPTSPPCREVTRIQRNNVQEAPRACHGVARCHHHHQPPRANHGSFESVSPLKLYTELHVCVCLQCSGRWGVHRFLSASPGSSRPKEVKNHSQRKLMFLKPSLGVCTSLGLGFSI